MPHLQRFRSMAGKAKIRPALPAVTCSAQADYLTGKRPSDHGIVGNGWYDRDLAEVHFWKQSNRLVQAPKVWEHLRAINPSFTCAQLFWWYNMYSSADYSITPRPIYPADGRKIFDVYSWPYAIRSAIKKALGPFPFPAFWGPAAGARTPQGAPDEVSRWIAGAAKEIERRYRPDLSLVYLPHLDYNLQRYGPEDPRIGDDLARIDAIVGDLIAFFRGRDVRVMVLSEYGISAVRRPIHINRVLRRHGWIVVKEELGSEILDCGASSAFAVADHQVAHVYLRDPSMTAEIASALGEIEGVDFVLGRAEKLEWGLMHPRAGDLIAVAKDDAWFTYYYWLDDAVAPDFARCVDIHRKPGYDPVELFIDPGLRFPRLRVGLRLLQKRLGMRMLMDVIPLDAALVKGSHGRAPSNPAEYPVVLVEESDCLEGDEIASTDIHDVIKRHFIR